VDAYYDGSPAEHPVTRGMHPVLVQTVRMYLKRYEQLKGIDWEFRSAVQVDLMRNPTGDLECPSKLLTPIFRSNDSLRLFRLT
jgi:hypothetical protein